MNVIHHPLVLQKIAGFGVDLIACAAGFALAAFLVITWRAGAQLMRLSTVTHGWFHSNTGTGGRA